MAPAGEAALTPILVHLGYSPWSEKARWALDHHLVPHKRRTYLPMVAAPWLRLRARRLRGRVTVPALLHDGPALMDSWDIARWAEARGAGPRLFAEGELDEIRAWNAEAEVLAAAGRIRVTARVHRNPAALRESVPRPLNRAGPVTDLVGELGVRYLERKYAFDEGRVAQAREDARGVLAAIAARLDAHRYLVGSALSWADISVACALQFVSPVEAPSLYLGPASREEWLDPELAPDWGPLLSWRDRLFARHRPADGAAVR